MLSLYSYGWLLVYVLLVLFIHYSFKHTKEILRLTVILIVALNIWIFLRVGVLIMETDWSSTGASYFLNALKNATVHYFNFAKEVYVNARKDL